MVRLKLSFSGASRSTRDRGTGMWSRSADWGMLVEASAACLRSPMKPISPAKPLA